MSLSKLPTTAIVAAFLLALSVMYSGYSLRIEDASGRLFHLEKSE